ncbi:MAG: hypothetical protein ACOY0T_06955 [Myxococcota bacterium]
MASESSARVGLGFVLGFGWVLALVGSGCATSEDLTPEQRERGGRTGMGGASNPANGGSGTPMGGTPSGNGGATGSGGSPSGNGGATGSGGMATGAGGTTVGSGGTTTGSGGKIFGSNGGTATGSGGTLTGSGGTSSAGTTAMGGKTSSAGAAGTAGTAGGSSTCDWDMCASKSCMTGCPTNDGGHCARVCGEYIACFQMNPGCSTSADPLCVTRNSSTGKENVCTMKWESAGGMSTGPAAMGPTQVAARYVSCACGLTIPGVTASN